ncbi:MAG TPA: translation initiation factor IF-1 [Sandaracinaceae bacterium LLY-WYZ-13_1]|nr:translation initiation factor IF-1 [Sandaracinaceae bacterium LLY-WYZ-13_1]
MARRRGGGGRRRRKGKRKSFDSGNDDRSDHVKLEGTVTNVFAGGQFEIETDAGPTVRAKLCGRMRKYRIRVILGDRVTVALSPYDLNHGMIVYRTK